MRKLNLLKRQLSQWSEKMDSTKINELSIQLRSLSGCDATQPFPLNVVLNLREGIASVAQQISGINLPISNHLLDLKNTLFTESPYQSFYINLTVYGQTIEVIEFIKGQIFAANQAIRGCVIYCTPISKRFLKNYIRMEATPKLLAMPLSK